MNNFTQALSPFNFGNVEAKNRIELAPACHMQTKEEHRDHRLFRTLHLEEGGRLHPEGRVFRPWEHLSFHPRTPILRPAWP